MPRYCTTVTTNLPPDQAFQYMASFDHVAEWDPGVVRAERLDPDGLGVGSRFRVVLSVAGQNRPLEYKISQYDPPRRVVLVAENAVLRSTDEITVAPAADGATVTYDANLELLGVLRVFNPALGLVFNRVGDRAAAGLRRKLEP